MDTTIALKCYRISKAKYASFLKIFLHSWLFHSLQSYKLLFAEGVSSASGALQEEMLVCWCIKLQRF